jgi:excisionase family DNA binding protein
MKKLLTKKQVAEYFQVHGRTIERWLDSGVLVGYKLGAGKTAVWRIPQIEIDKFLIKHINKKNAQRKNKQR